MTYRYNIRILQGSSYNQSFTYATYTGSGILLDSSLATAVDLTGYSARLQIRHNHNSDIVLHEATTQNAQISILAPSGSVTINIPASVTDTFDFDEGYYDLEIYNGTLVNRLLEGSVVVSKQITK